MITAERLKELIKQGATIYQIGYNGFWEIPLINNKENHFNIYHNRLHIHELEKYEYSWDNRWTDCYIELDKLFETKDQAEWKYKTTAERTERFEPPMWKDIDIHYTFDWFNQGCHYRLAVNQPRQYIIVINFSSIGDIFNEPATKENYIKACEIVRDLFKNGGAK